MTKLRLNLALMAFLTTAAAHSANLSDYPSFLPILLSGDRILFRCDHKFGYANIQGKVLIAPEYDQLSYFNGGRVFGLKDSSLGFLSESGKFEPLPALRFVMQEGGTLSYNADLQAFVARMKNNKMGLLDSSGKWIIPPKYNTLFPGWTKDEPLSVSLDGKFGFIDLQENWILSGYAYAIWLGNDYVAVMKEWNRGYQIVDRQGELLSQEVFQKLARAGEGMYYYQQLDISGDVEHGFLTIKNRRVQKVFRISSIKRAEFSEGRVFACPFPPKPSYLGSHCTYFDKQGKIITKTGYSDGSKFYRGKAVACRVDIEKKTQYCAWLDKEGKVLVEKELKGSLNMDLANDQVAIISSYDHRWIFFYPDGSTKEFAKPLAER